RRCGPGWRRRASGHCTLSRGHRGRTATPSRSTAGCGMSCWRAKSSPACWRRGCWGSSGKSSTTRSGRTVRWATARRRRSRRRACGPTPQSLRRPAGTTGTVEPTLIATGPLFGGRSVSYACEGGPTQHAHNPARVAVMPMNYDEAKRQLVLHAGAIDEAQKAMILEDGFLPSLRPYRGLQEKNIHLVMEALLTVGERIHSAPQVDRELITTIWWMCTTARLWGLRPDGMLQACKLLTAEDI